MKKQDFYYLIDDIVEVEPGTVNGATRLNDLEAWDSLSVLQFVVSVDKFFGVTLSAGQVAPCRIVDDLVALLDGKIE
jgi:acyl carrier protein